MGLFDRPLCEIRSWIESKYANGRARELPYVNTVPLAQSAQVILSEDTGLELGNPGVASRSLLLWDSGDGVNDERITLVGPDFKEARADSLPFAQVIMVGGDFSDEYDCYRDLRDATYNLRLRGFMTRVFPGRQSIWCRVSRDALASGFSAQILASSIIRTMKELPFVNAVEILFVTSSKSEVEELSQPADMVLDIVEALIKMYEEMNFDCESCDYVEVCDSVVELRQIRERLQADRENGKREPGAKGGERP